jgi:hypothetical protein
MATSKTPPRPPFTVNEDGRRQYEGSLASSIGMSKEHENIVLREIMTGPRMPSDLLETTGLSAYNPHNKEGIARFLADLVRHGTAIEVRDGTGKFLGWRHVNSKEK